MKVKDLIDITNEIYKKTISGPSHIITSPQVSQKLEQLFEEAEIRVGDIVIADVHVDGFVDKRLTKITKIDGELVYTEAWGNNGHKRRYVKRATPLEIAQWRMEHELDK